MSQAKLAEKIAVSQSVISRLESGEDMPSVDRMQAIARALQVPLSVLFGEADGVFDTEQVALLWKISQYKPEQKQMLIQRGTDYLQGYYFSKPLPEDQFLEYLGAGNF